MKYFDYEYDEFPVAAGFDPPKLLDVCLRHISLNLSALGEERDGALHLRADIALPAEICDRLLVAHQRHAGEATDGFLNAFADTSRTRLRRVLVHGSSMTHAGLELLLRHGPEELDLIDCPLLARLVVDERARALRKLRVQSRSAAYSSSAFWRSRSLENHLTNLTFLCTYGAKHVDFDWICELRSLRHLDISGDEAEYSHPDERLAKLVAALPRLESLDISGTNLAGERTGGVRGLASRKNDPLKFLGLFGASGWACLRSGIPALRVSGHADVDQILAAATLYNDRPLYIARALNYLYLSILEIVNHDLALLAVVRAMNLFFEYREIQASGTVLLFYIMSKRKKPIGAKLKRHAMHTLLRALDTPLSYCKRVRDISSEHGELDSLQ